MTHGAALPPPTGREPIATRTVGAAAGRVPERIAERYAEFVRCTGCDRIYWQGSHWECMGAMLGAALAIRDFADRVAGNRERTSAHSKSPQPSKSATIVAER